MQSPVSKAIEWTEQGLVPDAVVRFGIRRLLRQRLNELRVGDSELMAEAQQQFVQGMYDAETAPLPHKANEQHYEVPAVFYEQVLGPYRKYSCCYFPDGVDALDTAESSALEVTCQRARIRDGQSILDLGCGWGSLSLWMAEHYPDSQITALSNSHSQRDYIEESARERGLRNLSVITRDMNLFDTDARYDRIVSVEVFEHMRNWPRLFGRVAGWLNEGGLFFMHVFCHRDVPYTFVDRDAGDWMSRHFFTGGMMPSDDLALYFQQHLKLVQRWRWDGRHYANTAEAWLRNMDAKRSQIWPILEHIYGADSAQHWWMRWRIFFMACAEMFAHDEGRMWWVSHYLFEPETCSKQP